MAKRNAKRTKKQTPKVANGFELKPHAYQPSKKELEEDIRVPASFDRMMDALFASDRRPADGQD